MTTPDDRKTLQVSPAVHAAVYELATELGTSASGALDHLLDKSTIRVHVSAKQRQRWNAEARKDGLALSDWVSHRIEALLHTDNQTINQIFYRVEMLCQAAGVTPPKPPRRPLKPKESP